MINNAIKEFIVACCEQGILEEVLEECGFTQVDAEISESSTANETETPILEHLELTHA